MPKAAARDAESRRLKFTQLAVDRMNAPAEKRIEVWDTVLPGFGLRIAPSGRKSWQVLYRVQGRPVRETLGTLATMPKIEDARSAARASLTRAGAGGNPVAERRAAEKNTLDVVLDTYLEKAKPKERERDKAQDADAAGKRRPSKRKAGGWMRPAYYAETKRALDHDVRPALGRKNIREVTRREIRDLLDGIVERGSPSHANHVLSYLRAALNWAAANDYLENNPCNGIERPAETVERERALDDDEIRLFWLACNRLGYPFGPLFQLLLLTAQRRSEVSGATRPEFQCGEAALWTIPRERAKSDRTHLVHLSPAAIKILEALPTFDGKGLLFTTGETPVSGWSIARARLARAMLDIRREQLGDDGAAEIKPFTLHDLRRTATTGMAGIGIAPHVVDKILNHVTGTIEGVARIYNRFEYLPERKIALDAWARHIEALVKRRKGNVAAFRRHS